MKTPRDFSRGSDLKSVDCDPGGPESLLPVVPRLDLGGQLVPQQPIERRVREPLLPPELLDGQPCFLRGLSNRIADPVGHCAQERTMRLRSTSTPALHACVFAQETP